MARQNQSVPLIASWLNPNAGQPVVLANPVQMLGAWYRKECLAVCAAAPVCMGGIKTMLTRPPGGMITEVKEMSLEWKCNNGLAFLHPHSVFGQPSLTMSTKAVIL